MNFSIQGMILTLQTNCDVGCMRGDEPYRRPYGWMRFALKVLNKYPDGNAWLGPDGWRSHSMPGEWPVSYHGTGLQEAKGIIQSYYQTGRVRSMEEGFIHLQTFQWQVPMHE